ncbi:MAG: hypothetical protein JSV52_01910 [Candidatus Zixiibacteriota bacterium]|nr:MAG: hypothetical protein JSV52_01910 [candidate division Zixibacteria bacterium]
MSKKLPLTALVILLMCNLSFAQNDLPASFDWRDSSIFTPVKHQGNCGSCGEFAAVALTEALIKKQTGREVDLSEQQVVSCVPGCGCNAGCAALDALKYIRDHGIVLESDFPYLQKDTACIDDLEGKYFVGEVHSLTIDKLSLADRILRIKETILRNGPVATNLILYDDLDRYRGGVYKYDGESEALCGHWVLIVGWCDDSSVTNGGYWICRNSWGEKWGEGGYFNSAYGDVTGIDDFYIVWGTAK